MKVQRKRNILPWSSILLAYNPHRRHSLIFLHCDNSEAALPESLNASAALSHLLFSSTFKVYHRVFQETCGQRSKGHGGIGDKIGCKLQWRISKPVPFGIIKRQAGKGGGIWISEDATTRFWPRMIEWIASGILRYFLWNLISYRISRARHVRGSEESNSLVNMTAPRRVTLIKLLRLDFARLIVVMRCVRRGGYKCGGHVYGGRWGGFVVQPSLPVPAQVVQGTAARRRHCLHPRKEERSSRGAAPGSGMIHGCSLAESIYKGHDTQRKT